MAPQSRRVTNTGICMSYVLCRHVIEQRLGVSHTASQNRGLLIAVYRKRRRRRITAASLWGLKLLLTRLRCTALREDAFSASWCYSLLWSGVRILSELDLKALRIYEQGTIWFDFTWPFMWEKAFEQFINETKQYGATWNGNRNGIIFFQFLFWYLLVMYRCMYVWIILKVPLSQDVI